MLHNFINIKFPSPQNKQQKENFFFLLLCRIISALKKVFFTSTSTFGGCCARESEEEEEVKKIKFIRMEIAGNRCQYSSVDRVVDKMGIKWKLSWCENWQVFFLSVFYFFFGGFCGWSDRSHER